MKPSEKRRSKLFPPVYKVPTLRSQSTNTSFPKCRHFAPQVFALGRMGVCTPFATLTSRCDAWRSQAPAHTEGQARQRSATDRRKSPHNCVVQPWGDSMFQRVGRFNALASHPGAKYSAPKDCRDSRCLRYRSLERSAHRSPSIQCFRYRLPAHPPSKPRDLRLPNRHCR